MENEELTSDEMAPKLAAGSTEILPTNPREMKEIPGGFKLLPPAREACQVCAQNPPHPPEYPHNRDSLYYQYFFYAEDGRWPTWTDALAHCDDETKKVWFEGLRALDVPEELITGPAGSADAKE